MDVYKVNKDMKNVGPGSHTIANSVGRDSPMISLKSRFGEVGTNKVPGPGSYEIKSPIGKHATISLGSRPDKRGIIM